MENKDNKQSHHKIRKFNNSTRYGIGADVVKAKDKINANANYSNLNKNNKSSINFNSSENAVSIKFDSNNPCAVRGMKALEIFRLFTTILSDSIEYGEHVADEVRTKNVCLLGHGAIAPLLYLEQNGVIMPVHLANANAGVDGVYVNAAANNNANANNNAPAVGGGRRRRGNAANAANAGGVNVAMNAPAVVGGHRRRGNVANAANADGVNVAMNAAVNADPTPQQLVEERAYELNKSIVQKAYTSERIAYITRLEDFRAFVLKNRVSEEILAKLRKEKGFSNVCGKGSNAVQFIEWFQESLFKVLGKEERELEAEYKALLEGGFMIKHCDGDALLYIEYVEDIIDRYNQLQIVARLLEMHCSENCFDLDLLYLIIKRSIVACVRIEI